MSIAEQMRQFAADVKGHPHETEIMAATLMMGRLEQWRRETSRWHWIRRQEIHRTIERLRDLVNNELLPDTKGEHR